MRALDVIQLREEIIDAGPLGHRHGLSIPPEHDAECPDRFGGVQDRMAHLHPSRPKEAGDGRGASGTKPTHYVE